MLFPPDRIPDDLKSKDRLTITLQIVLFFTLYLFLGWLANHIVVVSLGMLVIACIDFNTRKTIHQRIRLYFSDERYAPTQEERLFESIRQRRLVVEWFLFKLPQLRKEAGRIAGCALSFCIAIYGYFANIEWLRNLAYIVLIGTLVINEVFTVNWRFERDRRFKII